MTNPIIFYILAAGVLVTGWNVVHQKNLFHAGISLITCFLGVAGIYVTLNAPFLAAMQVLIYAGAIAVVLLFAFMLTHDLMHSKAQQFQPVAGLATAITLGTVLIGTIWGSPWSPALSTTPLGTDVEQLASGYMTSFFVPFQLIALLLLITLMGAVVIARKEEGPRPSEDAPK